MSPLLRASAPALALGFGLAAACVPPGNSTPDSGPAGPQATPTAAFKPSENVMREPFEDNFDRRPAPRPSASAVATVAPSTGPSPSGSAPGPSASSAAIRPLIPPDAAASATPSAVASLVPLFPSASAAVALAPENDLGPDWRAVGNAWRIDKGKLCGQKAKNQGVWLTKTLPVNARIEFDASSDSADGDLKAEVWGDGRSAATEISYTNATSYLVIFGGWKNKIHALARINEHGKDRKEVAVDPQSDDPRQKPVVPGQIYRFKIERTDGRTVRWFINDVEMLVYNDPQPLAGAGHDHFGFNDWEARVCFDNVKVTPL